MTADRRPTVYRALFTRGDLQPGQRLLVQGVAGGTSTAAILLGKAAGSSHPPIARKP